MSEEFGLTNAGDNIVPVPVELKDHSADPVLVPEVKVEVPVVQKKKRGRPAKRSLTPVQGAVEVAPVEEVVEKLEEQEKIWYCSSCRETISDQNVMKIGAGTNRYAVFCPMCQRSFGFIQPDVDKKVAAMIKDNPTGKSEKA